jgi:hypothetical protein
MAVDLSAQDSRFLIDASNHRLQPAKKSLVAVQLTHQGLAMRKKPYVIAISGIILTLLFAKVFVLSVSAEEQPNPLLTALSSTTLGGYVDASGASIGDDAIIFTATLTGANDVPSNASVATGYAILTLEDNTLTYYIRLDRTSRWRTEIHGPAASGNTAPAIFAFHGANCIVPNPPDLGGCVFYGTVTISDEQRVDLLAGLWYVLAYTAGESPQSIRGQIALPEIHYFRAELNGSNVVPPTDSSYTAVGTFVLSNSVLRFEVASPVRNRWHAIHGPAEVGENGPLIFSSGLLHCAPFPRAGPCVWRGEFVISDTQATELLNGLWYVVLGIGAGDDYGVEHVRGQILLDDDLDGVPDISDNCLGTPINSIVNSEGCSIEQLCPCDGRWRNHGEYLKCVRETTRDFSEAGLLADGQRVRFLIEAAKSHCGRRRP